MRQGLEQLKLQARKVGRMVLDLFLHSLWTRREKGQLRQKPMPLRTPRMVNHPLASLPFLGRTRWSFAFTFRATSIAVPSVKMGVGLSSNHVYRNYQMPEEIEGYSRVGLLI